jgi:hypothetical protein
VDEVVQQTSPLVRELLEMFRGPEPQEAPAEGNGSPMSEAGGVGRAPSEARGVLSRIWPGRSRRR